LVGLFSFLGVAAFFFGETGAFLGLLTDLLGFAGFLISFDLRLIPGGDLGAFFSGADFFCFLARISFLFGEVFFLGLAATFSFWLGFFFFSSY